MSCAGIGKVGIIDMIEFQQVFGSRKKGKYGLFSNIRYCMQCAYENDKRLFYYQFLQVLPRVAAAYLGTLIPSEVVRALQGQWDVSYLVWYICLLTGIMLICNMLVAGMITYGATCSGLLPMYLSRRCFRKMMNLDYNLLEGEEEQKVIGNAWRALRNYYNFTLACSAFPQCVSAIFAIIFYGVIIGSKSVTLVLLMMFSVISSMKLLSLARKKHKEYHVKLSRHAKEAAYISRQAVESSAGKDIRIYQMLDWFIKKYDEALDNMNSIFASIHNWYFLRSVSDAVIGFLVDMLAWGYLIWLLVHNELTVAEFVLYLGLTSGFTAYLETLIRQAMQMEPMSVELSSLREFLELESPWGDSAEEKECFQADGAVTVELKNVSYTYPGNKKPTLSNINLTIRAGEKLALLGLNGAGKTTLVKLICGFYQPTEGQILVNGKSITSYERESYYHMLSVLFQDTTLLPVTLDMNITGQAPREIDREKLSWALSISGFAEKYNSLPEKGETLLVREVNGSALDYSGGEKQKLLFARALYKDSQLMLLDEPTAALDPIAENALYQNFSEATQGRTSIYISHRLSSTRFCDRIILLENGGIIEEGTHESLMQARGRYAELFELQGKYYKEQEELKKRSELMGDSYVEDEAGKEGIFNE